jgi:hypothetical protein
VCLKLKLGKSACHDGFYTDFWHKIAIRLIGDSSGREWRKDRTIMRAELAAVNATFAGEMLPPDHRAMQAIAPVLKPHLLGRAAGDHRDVTLTSTGNVLSALLYLIESNDTPAVLRDYVDGVGVGV